MLRVKLDSDEIEIEICDHVYPPGEDSFLLLDTLLSEPLRGKKLLEIGSGTGIISVSCAKIGAKVTSVDIKKEAVDCTIKNALRNHVEVDVRLGDLFEPVGKEKFDFIAFNAPYLPSDEFDKYLSEYDKVDLIGGRNGVEVSIRFIRGLSKHLKDDGKAFLVVSSLAKLEMVFEELKLNNLDFKKAKSVNFDFEELSVIEIKKG